MNHSEPSTYIPSWSTTARGALALLLVLPASLGCREATSEPPTALTVFATASLERPAREAGDAFGAAENVSVELRAGSTHELAAALSESAAADVFLAAGTNWMDRLEGEGRIVGGSRWEAVGNQMAVIGREGTSASRVRIVEMATLGFRRFVVADPDQEPAGQWTRHWLRKVGVRGPSVWDQLEDRREVVPGIGEVLRTLREDREAVGVAFSSDLGAVPGTEALFRSPDLGIRYSFALVDHPARPAQAARFLEFLQGPEGIDLLQRNGFLVQSASGG